MAIFPLLESLINNDPPCRITPSDDALKGFLLYHNAAYLGAILPYAFIITQKRTEH